jgi:GntR family transcriptional regulator / MocR family aminotransferase
MDQSKGPIRLVLIYHWSMSARTTHELAFAEPSSDAPLWQWLYGEIRGAILDGRLRRGTRVPATRALAHRYGVSRGTVVTAFEQLTAEGYLDGRVGDGTYVSVRLPDDFTTPASSPGAPNEIRRPRPLSRLAARLKPAPTTDVTAPRPFRPDPAIDAFPIDLWTQIAGRRLRRATRTLLADADPRGYRPFREAVADYLGSARGVRCSPDQVIVVAGIQHGLDLAIRVLLDPDAAVCLEDPCHPIVSAMFRALPARVVPVPVDARGLDVEAGVRCCRRPRLIYVTPAHQFPLGPMMTVGRRLALLQWAAESGAWIFEDDYDSEYRYDGRPIPALQGIDRSGSVIFSGSFSKVLLPTLRLGYLVVPLELVDKFAAARFMTDRHSSVLDQVVMCDFLTGGHFARHIRRMREIHAARLRVLTEAIKDKLAGSAEGLSTAAGISTIVWLQQRLKARSVVAAAAANGVDVVAVSDFVVSTTRPEGLVLGFAPYDTRQINDGVTRLARAIDKCANGVRRTASRRVLANR